MSPCAICWTKPSNAPAPSSKKKNASLLEDDKAGIARVIGLGAVKYAELSQHRLTDYIFNWDKMLSFQGNTAPYLQNAYVRIRSIFRRGELDPETPFGAQGQPLDLTEPTERGLGAETGAVRGDRPGGLGRFPAESAGRLPV